MLQKYHVKILKQALDGTFSPLALSKIAEANVNQDRISAQIGHDEYHFDNNAFDQSHAYIEEQRALVIASLHQEDAASAWSAFGRLTHTVQDFYAHSNYIDLWLALHTNGSRPAPFNVDPVEPAVLESGALRSGKIYYPLEVFSFIKVLKPLVLPLLPRDSHAWMNIDSPEQGFKFDYVMQASIQRTVLEFERTVKGLRQDRLKLFVDKDTGKQVGRYTRVL
ncbi:MAG: hypothetical protein ACM3XO_19480 [Bacteroidota bacterium]